MTDPSLANPQKEHKELRVSHHGVSGMTIAFLYFICVCFSFYVKRELKQPPPKKKTENTFTHQPQLLRAVSITPLKFSGWIHKITRFNFKGVTFSKTPTHDLGFNPKAFLPNYFGGARTPVATHICTTSQR